MAGPLLALALLGLAGSGLGLWARRRPRLAPKLLPDVALATVAVAFGVLTSAEGQLLWAEMLPPDPLGRVLAALYLAAWGLWMAAGRAAPSAWALYLLEVWGGLLALTGGNALLLWVGLGVYAVAELTQDGRSQAADALAPEALGLALLLLGLVLLYLAEGTFDLALLGRRLWARGGLQAELAALGALLSLAGIALATHLLPPYDLPGQGREALPALLGGGLLLRLGVGSFGALAWLWPWVLLAGALLALLWGLREALLAPDARRQLGQLAIAQQGFILLALAWAHHPQGLYAALASLTAYGLAQTGLGLVLCHVYGWQEAPTPYEPLSGLARHAPGLAAPLAIQLLSLAGLPALLGYGARAAALGILRRGGEVWLFIAGVAGSILCGWLYLRLVVMVLHDPAPRQAKVPRSWRLHLVAGSVALGLLLLGLYPKPLADLARLIGG